MTGQSKTPVQPPTRRFPRLRAWQWLVAAIASVIIILVAVFSIQSTRVALVDTILATAVGDGVAVTGLSSPSVTVFDADRVVVGSLQDPDAVIERVHAVLDLGALLTGRLRLDVLRAERLDVPAGSGQPSNAPPRLPVEDVADGLKALEVVALDVSRVIVERRARESINLTAVGSLVDGGRGPILDLKIEEVDGPGRATLRAGPENGRFVLSGQADVAGLSGNADIAVELERHALSGEVVLSVPPALPKSNQVSVGQIDVAATLSGTLGTPRIDATVEVANIVAFDRAPMSVTGALAVDLQGAALANALITGSGEFLNWRAALPEVESLTTANASWSARAQFDANGVLSIQDIQIDGGDLDVDASGRLDTDTGQTDGRLDARVAGIGRLFGIADTTSKTEINIDTESDRSYSVALAVDGASSLLPASPYWNDQISAQASVTMDGRRIELDDLQISSAEHSIVGRTSVNLTENGADIDRGTAALTLTLPKSSDGASANGATLQTEIAGPLSALSAHATVSAPQWTANGFTFVRPAIDLDLRRNGERGEGKFSVSGKVDSDNAAAAGTVSWMEGRSVDMALERIRLFPTEGTGQMRMDLATGNVSGTVELTSGNFARLARLVGFALTGGGKIHLNYDQAADHQALNARADLTDFEAGPIAAGTAGIDANIDLRAEQRIAARAALARGDVLGQSFDDLAVEVTGTTEQFDFSAEASGSQSGIETAAASGSVTSNQKETRVALDAFRVKSRPASLELASPTVTTITSTGVALPDATFTVNGGSLAMKFAQTGDTVDAVLTATNIGATLLEAPSGAFDTRIDARSKFTGLLSDLTVDGTITLVADEKAGPQTPTLSADFKSGEGRLYLNARLREASSGNAEIALEAPGRIDGSRMAVALADDGALSGSVRGEGDLANLARWLPLGDIDISGSIKADMAVRGTTARPAFTGGLAVAGGTFEDANLGLALTDVALEATARDDGSVSITFSGADTGRGTLTGEGVIKPSDTYDSVRAEMAANLDRLRVIDRDTISSRLSGSLNYSGSILAGAIAGKLTTADTELFLAATGEPEIPLLRTNGTSSSTPDVADSSDGGPLSRTTLEIDIQSRRPVQVMGEGIESSWDGRATIAGTLAEPVLNGTFSLLAGNVSFLGQTFELTSGKVELPPGAALDPVLDITAERIREGLTAVLNVTGRASAPKLQISSQPSYPRDEIMSRIMFGKDMSQLGPFEAAQIAAATTNILGSGPGITRVLRRGLALDYVGIGGKTGEAIEVRKNFGRNLSVGIEQDFNGRERLFTVEWQLTRQFALRSTTDGQAGADIGLTWSRDY